MLIYLLSIRQAAAAAAAAADSELRCLHALLLLLLLMLTSAAVSRGKLILFSAAAVILHEEQWRLWCYLTLGKQHMSRCNHIWFFCALHICYSDCLSAFSKMFNVHFSFFRNDKSFSFQVCLSATKGYLYSKVTFVLKNISVMVRVG